MRYITGIHALNLPCELETCGDWHQAAIQWKQPYTKESSESIFGDYGVNTGIRIPEHSQTFAVANHIRALLDLLEDGKFSLAQGMRKDFICTDKYNEEIFDQVFRLRNSDRWPQIDAFMGKEYCRNWTIYKKNREKGRWFCEQKRLARRTRKSDCGFS